MQGSEGGKEPLAQSFRTGMQRKMQLHHGCIYITLAHVKDVLNTIDNKCRPVGLT